MTRIGDVGRGTNVTQFQTELNSSRLPEWTAHAEQVQVTGARDGYARRKREEVVAVADRFAQAFRVPGMALERNSLAPAVFILRFLCSIAQAKQANRLVI